MRVTLPGILLGLVVALLLAIGGWLTVVYTGAYNVAASDPHADAVRWTFETTLHRSVASRADAVQLPDEVPEEVLAQGAGKYDESCVHCHGAPGREPAHWSRGMRPEPPHLAKAATDWTAGEIHWIVENGLKMSGMPAFGGHHDAEMLLAITAFVRQLPGLTSDDYRELMQGDAGTEPSQ